MHLLPLAVIHTWSRNEVRGSYMAGNFLGGLPGSMLNKKELQLLIAVTLSF